MHESIEEKIIDGNTRLKHLRYSWQGPSVPDVHALPAPQASDVHQHKHLGRILHGAVMLAQVVDGFLFPNAVMQYALPAIDKLSIDIPALQRKRDRLVEALRAAGYELRVPEGTFYLMSKSPLADDWAFCRLLAERGLYVLPGSVCEAPGHFRIAFTGSEEMIEQAIPIFAEVMAEAGTGAAA